MIYFMNVFDTPCSNDRGAFTTISWIDEQYFYILFTKIGISFSFENDSYSIFPRSFGVYPNVTHFIKVWLDRAYKTLIGTVRMSRRRTASYTIVSWWRYDGVILQKVISKE